MCRRRIPCPMKKRYVWGGYALFLVIMVFSDEVREGAMRGLTLWWSVLVPTLFPAFAAVGFLQSIGGSVVLSRWLAPAAEKVLGLSGSEAVVFLTGLSGGYPLGARVLAESVRTGQLSREDAERLYACCDNTGPAFAAGALGLGVYGDSRLGWLLWGIHVASAVITVRVYSRKRVVSQPPSVDITQESFGKALTGAIAGAISAILSVGGFVVFFSALPIEVLMQSLHLPTPVTSLVRGSLELSSGIGALTALESSPVSFALGAWFLSFGGICVHLQSVALTEELGIRSKKRLEGKLLQGVISAAAAYLAGMLLF